LLEWLVVVVAFGVEVILGSEEKTEQKLSNCERVTASPLPLSSVNHNGNFLLSLNELENIFTQKSRPFLLIVVFSAPRAVHKKIKMSRSS
jgi:hypothetical protein